MIEVKLELAPMPADKAAQVLAYLASLEGVTVEEAKPKPAAAKKTPAKPRGGKKAAAKDNVADAEKSQDETSTAKADGGDGKSEGSAPAGKVGADGAADLAALGLADTPTETAEPPMAEAEYKKALVDWLQNENGITGDELLALSKEKFGVDSPAAMPPEKRKALLEAIATFAKSKS